MRCPLCSKKRDDLIQNQKYAWCKDCKRVYKRGSLEVEQDTFVEAIQRIGKTVKTEEKFHQTYTDK